MPLNKETLANQPNYLIDIDAPVKTNIYRSCGDTGYYLKDLTSAIADMDGWLENHALMIII